MSRGRRKSAVRGGADSRVVAAGREPPTLEAALQAYALAERMGAWEDDVSSANLAAARRMYARAAQLAKLARKGRQPPYQEAHSADVAAEGGDVDSDVVCELMLSERRAAARELATAAGCHSGGGRWVWAALLGLACVALVAVGGWGWARRARLREYFDLGDVSWGRPWTASSSVPFAHRRGILDDFSSPFFFHTQLESSPWVQIDLGHPMTLSSAKLVNRTDCCRERAVPLVLEVSADRHTWREVAKKKQAFKVWHARFHATGVRWFRARAVRRTLLHLKSITLRS